MIRRRVVEPEGEYLLLGSMIMDKDVLASAYNRHKSGELQTRHFTSNFKPIFRWVISYYKRHGKAPKNTIGEIFKRRKKLLSKDTQEVVEHCLDKIAEEYSEKAETADADYVRNEILPDFIRERELSARLERAQNKIESGEFDSAEKIISEYARVSVVEEDENLGTIIPFSKDYIKNKGFSNEVGEPIFKFRGDLGKMVGPLCKSWLVALTGVEKAGKSYVLQEMAFDAAIYQRKKVLIVNLELNERTTQNRQWRRIAQRSNEDGKGNHLIPILDCENNQNRTCKILKKFPNRRPLLKGDMEETSWFKSRDWKVCTKCRNSGRKNAKRTKRFIPVPWFEKNKIRMLSEVSLYRALKRYKMMPVKNIRTRCFPRFSITFDEGRDYIMRYIDKTGWKPHMIIWDYLDILASESERLQDRIDIDRKWKKASRLAGELDCLVVTADQANKAGRTQYSLDQMSTSESKTKDSHLDVRIALNQIPEEKALGLARMCVLFHRHAQFNIKREVVVTQKLATAEPLTDNAFLYDRGKKIRVTNRKV